jgi:two-component system, sensor histidine kinase YesM
MKIKWYYKLQLRLARIMIRKINDIPIRQKLLWIFMLFILLPMLSVYAVFFSQIKDEVALRERNTIDQGIDRVIYDLDYLVDSCFGIARDIAVDQNINEMIHNDYMSSTDYFDVYYEKLRDQIQMYATSYNNVIKVSIFADNDTLLNGGNIYMLSGRRKKKSMVYGD